MGLISSQERHLAVFWRKTTVTISNSEHSHCVFINLGTYDRPCNVTLCYCTRNKHVLGPVYRNAGFSENIHLYVYISLYMYTYIHSLHLQRAASMVPSLWLNPHMLPWVKKRKVMDDWQISEMHFLVWVTIAAQGRQSHTTAAQTRRCVSTNACNRGL